MIKELVVEDLGGFVIKAPEWINLPVDEQIQFQVLATKKAHPEYKAMIVFTYSKEQEPNWQKQIIEV